MKKRYLIAAALVAPLVFIAREPATGAGPGSVEWTTATKYEDGSALPESDVAGVEIAWGPSGGPYSAGSALVALPATSYALPALPTGKTCFVVRTVVTDAAAAAKPSAKFSLPTGEVCVAVPTRPGLPTGVRVVQ